MRDYRLALAGLTLIASAAAAQQPPAPVVHVGYVEQTEISPTVAVPGTIYSRNDVQVTAGVAGQLLMVAEPGTIVEAGDPVASVDKAPLLLQRAEQEVLLERAEINIRQLDSQLRRQRELGSSSLVSEFELEQTEAARDLAISEAKLTKVRIRQIDDQVRRADVRAPFTGVVTTRLHRAGEDVARGEVLAEMTDVLNLEVRAFVPLKHLPRTIVGDTIDIFTGDRQYTGSIRSLVPTGDVRSQTFEARIDLPAEASGNWTVGQLVSVGIPIRSGEQSIAVPRDALVLRRDGSYVFRINGEDKAERIKIDIGESSGELVAVQGNLAEGDRVAVRGAENLREGAAVKILLSQSQAEVAATGG
ncbi:MAG TPA: efflux RND transporter periplasmic adaptor subunit [Woeseiaceae bacterium]